MGIQIRFCSGTILEVSGATSRWTISARLVPSAMACLTLASARYGLDWLKSMCWNSSPGMTVVVVFGMLLTPSLKATEAASGLARLTSPFCMAGGIWVSSRMNR